MSESDSQLPLQVCSIILECRSFIVPITGIVVIIRQCLERDTVTTIPSRNFSIGKICPDPPSIVIYSRASHEALSTQGLSTDDSIRRAALILLIVDERI